MIGNRDSSLKIAEKIGAKAVCNNHDADRKAEFLEKEKGMVCVQADSEITLPFGTKRIFHPIPGFQAVKLEKQLDENTMTWNLIWGTK